MEYILNKNHINCHNLLFKNPVKNQNPDFLNYYKMIYTNHNYNLKYILLNISFKDFEIIQEKNIYYLRVEPNCNLFNDIYHIEKTILESINIYIHKNINYSCYNEMKRKKYIYMFSSSPNINQLYLKVSGIWESYNEIGIVYKLYYNTSTEKLTNKVC